MTHYIHGGQIFCRESGPAPLTVEEIATKLNRLELDAANAVAAAKVLHNENERLRVALENARKTLVERQDEFQKVRDFAVESLDAALNKNGGAS